MPHEVEAFAWYEELERVRDQLDDLEPGFTAGSYLSDEVQKIVRKQDPVADDANTAGLLDHELNARIGRILNERER